MTVVSLYVSVNWVKSMCSGHIYHNFSCCDDLSKLGKEYLNSLKCEVCTFFSIKLRKFWHTARLSRTNRYKVIKSENSPVFLAHPVYLVFDTISVCSCAYSLHLVACLTFVLQFPLFWQVFPWMSFLSKNFRSVCCSVAHSLYKCCLGFFIARFASILHSYFDVLLIAWIAS